MVRQGTTHIHKYQHVNIACPPSGGLVVGGGRKLENMEALHMNMWRTGQKPKLRCIRVLQKFMIKNSLTL